MMTKVFETLLGKIVEVYIDCMLVKSKAQEDHLDHLREAFVLVRQHRLRLNPAKCAFKVTLGNSLRFLVIQRGIKMAPKQVQEISQMRTTTTKKEIQSLTSRLAALNRFISRYFDRLQLFFAALKGADSTGWGPKCDEAFRSIKEYIASPLSISQPVDGEELYLYLAASTTSAHATLVRLDDDNH